MSARNKPELIYNNGKPVKVILDIKRYKQMLEELEDWKDIQDLEEIKKKNLGSITLSEYLAGRKKDV